MASIITPEAHRAEVEEWRETRNASLREPMSWLSLVALQWLREGDNRLGSGRAADLRLPSGPSLAGRLVRSDGDVRAYAEPGSGLTSGGRAVDGLPMTSDADAQEDREPTILELGALRMVLIRRGDRLGLRVWDTSATVLRQFEGIPHYPVDLAWRLTARFEPSGSGATIPIADVNGQRSEDPTPGAVYFEMGGSTHRLDALDGGDGRLWLVFADATSGRTTHGGGRFLYTHAPVDGRVVVDFNRAYNPPCALSPHSTCPLPPPQNRLDVPIEAGEKTWSAPRGT